VAKVAELLEVSKPWVYNRIKSGEFPVVELGDSKPKQRISAAVIQAYIDGRTYDGRKD
jgi:predicted DNA-binding transcriptional regulator AlpA